MRPVAPHMVDLVMARKVAGMSQVDVGDKIGLSSATVSNLECGESLRLPLIQAYAALFGLDVRLVYEKKVTKVEDQED